MAELDVLVNDTYVGKLLIHKHRVRFLPEPLHDALEDRVILGCGVVSRGDLPPVEAKPFIRAKVPLS